MFGTSTCNDLNQTGPLGTVASEYDLAGRRTRLTWPDAFYVTYDHLLTGETTAIRENGAASGIGVLATFAYDQLGRRTSLTRGNGTVTGYTPDPVSRLQQLTQDLPGTGNDLTLGFAYNPAGQIASTTRSNDLYAWTGHGSGTTSTTSNGRQVRDMCLRSGGTPRCQELRYRSMAARLALLSSLLASCGDLPQDAPSVPPSLTEKWEAQSLPGARMEDCLLKVPLTNPLEISVYQSLVKQIWEGSQTRNVPLFFTFSFGRSLFIILSHQCERRTEFAKVVEEHLRSRNELRPFNVEVVEASEAKSAISSLEM